MTPEQFEAIYPIIRGWIEHTLAQHAASARSVASLGFPRLPQYFRRELLAATKVLPVDVVPVPPLAQLGLGQFSDFENMNAGGITYLDTFFVQTDLLREEALHFHELVHVIQWQVLGAKGFLWAYGDGLEQSGYRNSPLEVMAYTLEDAFRKSKKPFDVAAVVKDQLGQLHPRRDSSAYAARHTI